MFERDSILVVESSDDADRVDFEGNGLPVLRRDGGWILRYRSVDGESHEHLIAGAVDDVDLAVHQARAYLDQPPSATAWPHT
jgi:hypothetical protein